ncbi:MAG: tRNA epoxyqueuosine(34) reductase QueG [Phycisphaeraceae bacterium]|nr:tRNA epoxyqueuosine(34) reductase QueG [Phycisphaeraceae bacterium]
MSVPDPIALGREVVRACLGLGFAAAGVARAEPSAWGEHVRAWLAAGKHGTMDWMAEYLEQRLDVGQLLPGARAVIIVADAYDVPGRSSEANQEGAPGPVGVIARYARGEDYHAIIRRRLGRLADTLRGLPAAEHADFRLFADTGPVLEREQAARAGLGWIGKHTLLIHPRMGSWFVLGGLVTTLDVAPDPDSAPIADHCGTCTRCIDACPTGAITPYSVDARRCVSYLTIEHGGLIDESLHSGIGDRLVGCDVCQDVCPFNGGEVFPPVSVALHAPRAALPLLEVLNWTNADRARVLSGSAAKRATLAMFKRNALIAAGNAMAGGSGGEHSAALRGRFADLASDPSEDAIVRETARQVLARLSA